VAADFVAADFVAADFAAADFTAADRPPNKSEAFSLKGKAKLEGIPFPFCIGK